MARRLWRHHPANAGARWQWLAVVGSDISVAPSAGSATAATLYFSDRLGGVEAFYRQCRFMVTGPIAFALPATVNQQLAHAVCADVRDSDRHRPPPNDGAAKAQHSKYTAFYVFFSC